MSTGGGNEGSPIAQVDLATRWVNLEETLAQLVRRLADLRQAATIPLSVDLQATQGVGVQIQRAADDAAQKLRFAFQTVGKADELQAGLRAVQGQMERIVSLGGELNVAIGGTTTTLRGKQSVADLLRNFGGLAGAAGTGGEVKLGISGLTEMAPGHLEAVGAIRTFTDETKKATLAQKKAAEETEKVPDWLRSWGAGARPQRGFSAMITEFLGNLGMGAVASNLLGGAGGLVAGGAIFHLGWEITNALSKIPDAVTQTITRNQQLEVQRAGLSGRGAELPGGLPPIMTGKLSEAERNADQAFLGALGAGRLQYYMVAGAKRRDEFESTLEHLQVQMIQRIPAGPGRAAALKRNVEYAHMAMMGSMYAGMDDPLRIAQSLYEVGWTNQPGVRPADRAGTGLAGAVSELLKNKAVAERIVAARREGGGAMMNVLSDEQVLENFKEVASRMMGHPVLRDNLRRMMFNATAAAVGSPEVAAQYQTAVKQTATDNPLASQYWRDVINRGAQVFGGKATLNVREQEYLEFYAKQREKGVPAEEATRRSEKDYGVWWHQAAAAAKDITDPLTFLSGLFGGQEMPGETKRAEIRRIAEAGTGNVPAMYGWQQFPFGKALELQNLAPISNPQFSFSSLSGFANKMQTEAGIQIDYPQRTAENTARTAAALERIEKWFPTTPAGDNPLQRWFPGTSTAHEASAP